MASYNRRLIVFLALVAALLAAPAMSVARTTPVSPAPYMPPTTASAETELWIPAAPSSEGGTTTQGWATPEKDETYYTPFPVWLYYTPLPTPSQGYYLPSATAVESTPGTAAALSVAGVMAMMLL
jgi:hypothetical protein